MWERLRDRAIAARQNRGEFGIKNQQRSRNSKHVSDQRDKVADDKKHPR